MHIKPRARARARCFILFIKLCQFYQLLSPFVSGCGFRVWMKCCVWMTNIPLAFRVLYTFLRVIFLPGVGRPRFVYFVCVCDHGYFRIFSILLWLRGLFMHSFTRCPSDNTLGQFLCAANQVKMGKNGKKFAQNGQKLAKRAEIGSVRKRPIQSTLPIPHTIADRSSNIENHVNSSSARIASPLTHTHTHAQLTFPAELTGGKEKPLQTTYQPNRD